MDEQLIAIVGILSGLAVSTCSLLLTFYLSKRRADHEREQMKYGVVYTHRFRAAMRIHVFLARLRARYEEYTYQGDGPCQRRQNYPAMEEAANRFRRSVCEYEVLFPEHIADGFDSIWEQIKSHLYYTVDEDRNRGMIEPDVRRKALAAMDDSISQVQIFMRKEFGVSSAGSQAVDHASSTDPPR
ncbi:MAG: hypothetical protein Q9O74_01600 [Planctomycetota bacterium]|nr:hypothetical protein [Planctomycetota bacterium]